uniref:NADH-ubiquinone oxidoreductase chain 4 n=1 Tax=Ophiocordycipitaceae sp. TaxID=1907519 RepID=A0A6M8PRF7_9HYPO|nr:NADH dehydrogenase subunit 4 [Ophiocordycipitaceae sp.]QKG63765.1 NADH dehydrogenase subunit 4 [Ophiocordycipitaceae sp.]
MWLFSLLTIPIIGAIIISSTSTNSSKTIALVTSAINMVLSLIIFAIFNYSTNQFQYVEGHFGVYLGIDGISIYFITLTTIILPIVLLSNWDSLKVNIKYYLIIMLLLEGLLLGVFMTLDIMLFYIFFESILPPLFILIGIYGSDNKIRASRYLFLYTLWGSLFLLLSILSIWSTEGSTYYDTLFKLNFGYQMQIFLFIGIFIAFAVKTPVYGLNNWLLKAHVESPLGGSIILAGIVLKLSLYGIFKLIWPILGKITWKYTFPVYAIGAITVLYGSVSTLITEDVKELIAYSSVAHASVYLMSAFSNTVQGVEGSIVLGLAHGFVSSGLFACAGGVLYDRTSNRSIYFYRGMVQVMPILSLLFFILCLGNCGTPLTFNFIGEFMSLSGILERLALAGILACTSIVLSAAYSIYMFNRISFGGPFTRKSVFDVNIREFLIVATLVIFTVILGVSPGIILDVLHYPATILQYKI